MKGKERATKTRRQKAGTRRKFTSFAVWLWSFGAHRDHQAKILGGLCVLCDLDECQIFREARGYVGRIALQVGAQL